MKSENFNSSTSDFMLRHDGTQRFHQLPKSHVMELVKRAKDILQPLPNMVDVTIHTRLTVVGDIHGQLDDLFEIFTQNGSSSRNE